MKTEWLMLNNSFIKYKSACFKTFSASRMAGIQNRHIVFFGESVPMFDRATQIAAEADIMVVVGTSLAVYPAAMLVRYAKAGVPIYVVDPGDPDTSMIRNPLTHIKERGAIGVPRLVEMLQNEFL